MTYKRIIEKLDKQEELLYCIDKKVAVIKSDLKRINGTILRHEKKNEEQDVTLSSHSISLSSIRAKMGLIGGIAGAVVTIIITLLLKGIL